MTYIRWMCGEDHAELFTYLGGTSPHAHVYKNSGILNLYPWYANYIQAINNYVPSEDWHFLDRYQVEQLFGYVLRNVFRGVLTCEEGSNIITENINNCVFSS